VKVKMALPSETFSILRQLPASAAERMGRLVGVERAREVARAVSSWMPGPAGMKSVFSRGWYSAGRGLVCGSRAPGGDGHGRDGGEGEGLGVGGLAEEELVLGAVDEDAFAGLGVLDHPEFDAEGEHALDKLLVVPASAGGIDDVGEEGREDLLTLGLGEALDMAAADAAGSDDRGGIAEACGLGDNDLAASDGDEGAAGVGLVVDPRDGVGDGGALDHPRDIHHGADLPAGGIELEDDGVGLVFSGGLEATFDGAGHDAVDLTVDRDDDDVLGEAGGGDAAG
jgi:hypothetical protein